MNLIKIILVFFTIMLSISLGKEETKSTYSNYKDKIIKVSSNYCLHIQGNKIDNNVCYNENILQLDSYYMKNFSLYDVLKDKILPYPKTKTIGLLRISNMIQKNLYLYHALNKLGST